MALASLDIDQTISAIVRRRPVLEAVLRAFGPLMQARDELAAELVTEVPRLPEFQRQSGAAGLPLLSGFSASGTGSATGKASEKMLPLLAGQQELAQYIPALKKLFGDSESAEALLEAILVGSAESFAKIAEANGLSPAILNFAAEFVISPVLRAIAKSGKTGDGERPWDEEGAWRQGYCPVCGTFPSIAWLDKPKVDEKNAFLAGGGGKKHYHCPMCGSDWTFRRSACPACEREGSETIEILRESGSHGERLDFCTHCKTYCPTVDLREMADVPNMDVMAAGMIHLDMVAAQQKLRPLRHSFWNTF